MRYLVALLILVNHCVAEDSPRKTTSLSGEWTFHRNGSKDTKTVTLPTHWETHEGLKFDGIGWYEKTIELPELPKGRRLLLHFDAVATHATVYWNDKKLGEHLGAWTPFRFDVTEEVKTARKHTIKVRVDEKVGHNTQGFLPIIAPHFGGIWQGVRLMEVNETYCNDLQLSVCKSNTGIVDMVIPFNTHGQIVGAPWYIDIELRDTTSGKKTLKKFSPILAHTSLYHTKVGEPEDGAELMQDYSVRCWMKFDQISDWSPSNPKRYEFRVVLGTPRRTSNEPKWTRFDDEVTFTWSPRTITTKADQFLLNGQPLSIRGVLNWGYYPPSLAPTPTEEQWRSDIRLIKSWGFNLMKCCLWVPPKRLLEIADEEGILIWLEYPTWHPKLTPQYQAELMQEYREFHQLDRNHPSVILRSLTCETGPSADLKVIQALYDQCKKMCGGLVVDDSSWIEWNHVFDFYDDHPYGNNHTWVATLDRLKKYIATSKYGVKPLCLGEAIAADTWVPTKPMLEAIAKAKADPKQAWSLDERGYPFWVPGFFDANQKWLERMGRVCGGPVDEDLLLSDSMTYAMRMRQFQMQTFAKEVPHGGYVVSVLRDFPLASMGLVDYANQPKWSKTEWDGNTPQKMFAPPLFKTIQQPPTTSIRKLSKLSESDLEFLEQGGSVYLHANGKPGSFPLRAHWFLRGAPFINRHHPVNQIADIGHFYSQHQHLQLASDVIPDINYLEEIDPILMLWDNHDIKEVKTHGLLFETKVGKGRLLVSAIPLDTETNAWKNWLYHRLLKHLDSGTPPRNALKPETIARMRAKLNEKKLDLTKHTWQFMPDGKNEGLTLGYEKPGLDDRSWKPIKIGQHWEGQGYPALDGWAWYRLSVEVPKDWAGVPMFLNSEGVDDAYELYVNGTKIGSGGDIPNKKTAFEDRTAHAIPAGLLKPGEKNVIAVRVYDWYGAGGIHRPMSLSNVPIGGVDILR